MEKYKLLSGEELVAKGITKIDSSLPEIGLKDIIPNGSWLQQKQTQAALEARKNLLEVDRIEKCGILSHAEWRDDLMLAEVTQKVGGYWQYLGHNVGKTLYLSPDEALFLMEVNCLLLKHNEVTISLQKAYSLLLNSSNPLIQYLVYASLSKLGYKVFRHKGAKIIAEKSSQKVDTVNKPENDSFKDNKSHIDQEISPTLIELNNIAEDEEILSESQKTADSGIVLMEVDKNSVTTTADEMINITTDKATGSQYNENSTKGSEDFPNNAHPSTSNDSIETYLVPKIRNSHNNKLVYNNLSKIEKIIHRQIKPSDPKTIQKHFENIPDLFKKEMATVNVPEQHLIPENIYLNKLIYLLNFKNIKTRSMRSMSTESSSYTSCDEVNRMNVGRIRSRSAIEYPFIHNLPHVRVPRHNHFRPYGHWRPQNNMNYFQFNMVFQRPSIPNMFLQSRFQYLPRPHAPLRSSSYNSNLNTNNPNISDNSRKRTRYGRTAVLQSIKDSQVKLKKSFINCNKSMDVHFNNVLTLLHSYNLMYKSRLRLTGNFDVVNDENIAETIVLDDDEESITKKSRVDKDNNDKFDENLYRLRQFALRLKDLESKDKATASHRRAFSKAIKTFNNSYNADVYLNDGNYEVIDRRFITLESSSESDCGVVEETPIISKGKKLRNPFSILKYRSERLSLNNPGTSKDNNKTSKNERNIAELDSTYNEFISKTFDKSWLPSETNFGRAEVVPKHLMNARLIESGEEQYVYDFIRDSFRAYENWLDAKVSFLRHLEATNIAYQNERARILVDSELSNVGLRPLIDLEDCSDQSSLLEKLRIIKNNKTIITETSLSIDFDMYNRDIQNFKKTSPPKPHYRIICLDDSSNFPSIADLMALHSKYDDNVAIVFAIVGVGSIMYIQMNPSELPINVPSNDIV